MLLYYMYRYIEMNVFISLKLHCYMCYFLQNPDNILINVFYFIISHKFNFTVLIICDTGSHSLDLLDGEGDVYSWQRSELRDLTQINITERFCHHSTFYFKKFGGGGGKKIQIKS